MTTTEKTDRRTTTGTRSDGGSEALAVDKAVPRSPLVVLAAATATHGTGRDGDIPLPRLPGFVESAFSPLVYEVAARCLTERPADHSRTAVVLASLMGDTTTADLASRRVVSGRVHNPLLFMQATPNSVLGHLSREFGITGQMFSVSTFDDPVTELLDMADLLLEDPELEQVLVVGVELGGGERWAAVHRELSAEDGRPVPDLPASAALAAAVLLGRPGSGAHSGSGALMTVGPTETFAGERSAAAPHAGSVQGLFDLADAHRRLPRDTERDETESHAHQ
ncbi:beta-ketoacyl synthase N-terminal-like domain-containing protein [Streptomyces caniscabiei]|nr:beta-ketoacyl synthase N-terminal-like domain-containing protein [Streptomyces caniscabiei]MDX2599401.1 beta-ketoacyl synthase N-terminal-like domain-containing protein [Streptomyces caniscabiei]MDX2738326.1 beta-ketoacyl synthase N-terminal-like domain-containing protein [Streptomyces caniscabiei]MDX2777448.1 beta-ketoacyl synthase N-terminal-like domain-containing protein [Streptomyces caniscabiei]